MRQAGQVELKCLTDSVDQTITPNTDNERDLHNHLIVSDAIFTRLNPFKSHFQAK